MTLIVVSGRCSFYHFLVLDAFSERCLWAEPHETARDTLGKLLSVGKLRLACFHTFIIPTPFQDLFKILKILKIKIAREIFSRCLSLFFIFTNFYFPSIITLNLHFNFWHLVSAIGSWLVPRPDAANFFHL